MKELRIKIIGVPARCDICHQTDLFDAINNNCLRCNIIQMPVESKQYHLIFEKNKKQVKRMVTSFFLISITYTATAILFNYLSDLAPHLSNLMPGINWIWISLLFDSVAFLSLLSGSIFFFLGLRENKKRVENEESMKNAELFGGRW